MTKGKSVETAIDDGKEDKDPFPEFQPNVAAVCPYLGEKGSVCKCSPREVEMG